MVYYMVKEHACRSKPSTLHGWIKLSRVCDIIAHVDNDTC